MVARERVQLDASEHHFSPLSATAARNQGRGVCIAPELECAGNVSFGHRDLGEHGVLLGRDRWPTTHTDPRRDRVHGRARLGDELRAHERDGLGKLRRHGVVRLVVLWTIRALVDACDCGVATLEW